MSKVKLWGGCISLGDVVLFSIFAENKKQMSPLESRLRLIGDRVLQLKQNVLTEEATKTSFILPFLQSLGYDIFNPLEVIPEYTADLGIKKGEKVDYCVQIGGSPIMIIECKPWTEKLDPHNTQLFRYFHVTKTRIGVLTNGVTYKFYTDLDEPNKMDEKPFLEFDITDLKSDIIYEIEKFNKDAFNIDAILISAESLRLSSLLNVYLLEQYKNPSEEFVKFLAGAILSGRITKKELDKFQGIVAKGFQSFVKGQVAASLRSALQNTTSISNENDAATVPSTEQVKSEERDSKIVTTAEEIESFYVVKSILRESVSADRIFYRDYQGFFSVLIDDSVRKCVCRLYLNGKTKFIGIFNSNKEETKIQIEGIDDIFKHGSELVAIANHLST